MRRLREILRNEYIGAIAIGFLLAHAIGEIIGTILQPVIFYLENRNRRQSIFAAQQSYYNWPQLLLSVVSIVLYLLAAWLLLYWLYLKKTPEAVVAAEVPTADEPDKQP